MKVVHSFSEVDKDEPLSLAFGYFDGVHLGHRQIIIEENENYKNCVVTFDKHPMDIIDKTKSPKRLMTIDEKIEFLEEMEVEYLFVIHFDSEFMNLSDMQFLDLVTDNVTMKKMKVGFNYHFGKNGMGNAEKLKKIAEDRGFELRVVDEYKLDGERVCSTIIRKFIQEGKIHEANKFLGRPYSVHGKVVEGKHLGKQIGVPTANVFVDEEKAMPKNGVYVSRVTVDDRSFYGISNVGVNPTFNEKKKVEIYIFDFDEDIYGKDIKIEFLDFEREEKAFDSVDELKETIERSIDYGKKYVATL